ncbi:MAG: hypothetical protein OEV61_05310 [Chloroflexota bacterium]|nr:hypothetical protein [Chloroflexota bacterium]MDH5244450.1 hypothetical protein [Chloroflexota bacterium]
MATEQDAARDRVLAARRELAGEIEVLEASARAAVDIPAKVRRSPAKAAAIAGGLGFLVLKGPQRVMRLGRNTIRGKPAPMPKSLLPEEVDKTLRSFGEDGEAVRAVLERDFAAYAKDAKASRQRLRTLLVVAVARPFVLRLSKVAAQRLFAPSEDTFADRLEQVRARATQHAPFPGDTTGEPVTAPLDRSSDPA